LQITQNYRAGVPTRDRELGWSTVVILRAAAEIEHWMTAPVEEALKLQRPLADGSLKIVMIGEKEDPVA